jgi:FecR-like protein
MTILVYLGHCPQSGLLVLSISTGQLSSFIVIGLVLATGVALAEEKIGKATTVRNKVEGILDGPPRPLSPGSEVFSNELVRTSDGSVARLVFLDNTGLAVGPQSEILLDKFVYDPKGGTPGNVIVQMSRGAFRFVTGAQDHRNYTINTPYATLGVRGTIFDVVATAEKVDIHLLAGGLQVRTSLDQLIDLDTSKNFLTVLSTGQVIGPLRVEPNKSLVDFHFGGGGAGGDGNTPGAGQLTSTLADAAGGLRGGSPGGNDSGNSQSAAGGGGAGGSTASFIFPCRECGRPAPPAPAPVPGPGPEPGPVVSAPGPIAGAGLPGLVVVSGAFLVWARRRLRRHLPTWLRAAWGDRSSSKRDVAPEHLAAGS